MPDVHPEELAEPAEVPSAASKWRGRIPMLLGALAATGAGAGAYRHLRRRRLSQDPALRAMQLQSKGKFTRVMPGTAKERGGILRFFDRMANAGGGRVVYEKDLMALKERLGKAPKIRGALLHRQREGSSYASGDVNLASNQAAKDIHARLQNDKWREYQMLSKTTPGAMGRSENIKKILSDLGYRDIPTDPAARAEMLGALQKRLHKTYGKGFLVKDTLSAETGGAFPTEKHDFNDLYDRWMNSGYHKEKSKILEAEGLSRLGSQHRKDLKVKYRDTYSGRVIEKMLSNPEKAMVQEKLPIERGSWLGGLMGRATGNPNTKEMRVHVINGVVVPGVTINRFDPMVAVTGRKHMRHAENAAREVVNNLPKKYRGATFAMDIAPVRNPATGKMEYRTIETNPSGVSGMLYAHNNPIAGLQLHRAFTGQHSKSIAGAGAGLAGALAGAGTYQAAKAVAGAGPKAEDE